MSNREPLRTGGGGELTAPSVVVPLQSAWTRPIVHHEASRARDVHRAAVARLVVAVHEPLARRDARAASGRRRCA